MIGRVIRRLASAKLAAVLIAVLMGLTVINVLLPQKTYFSVADFSEFTATAPGLAAFLGAVGLDAVFGGWLIIVVALVLCANVMACTWLRIRRRQLEPHRSPVRTESRALRDGEGSHAMVVARSAADSLEAQGWHTDRREDGFTASRSGLGFWGSVVLHLSIIVLAVGGGLTPLTTFSGSMLLSEGQSIIDAPEAYLSVTKEPRLGESFTGSQITLNDMTIEYDDGVVVHAEADMAAQDRLGDSKTKPVSVNYPLVSAGKSYLLEDTGFAADLVLTSGDARSAVVLNLADRSERGFSDTLVIAQDASGATEVLLTVTPVPLEPGARAPAEMLRLADPRLEIRTSQDATPIAVLAPGESMELADGMAIEFTGARYWNTYMVRSAPARLIVYAGFALALLGSVLRFGSADRRVGMKVLSGSRPQVAVAYSSRPWGRHYGTDRAMMRRYLSQTDEGEET